MLRFLLIIAVLAITSGAASAQTVTQECPTGEAVCVLQNGQYINRVVNDDVDDSGARVRDDRVYQPQRGAIYLFDGQIINDGYHLRIVGAEGEGDMPLVYATETAGGSTIGNFIRQQADVTLKNVAFSGVLDVSDDPAENEAALAFMPSQVVRVEAAGFRLVIDNVVMSNVRNEFIRAASALKALYMTNSVVVNGGYQGLTNLGNGKAIDLRDGSIDSLVVRNSTFANFTDRIIRHRQSVGALDVVIFDHNTVMNDFGYHGMFALGRVGKSVQISNNLFFDNFVAGSDTSDTERQSEFNESGELDASGSEKMTWVLSEPNDVTEWFVENNVYVVSPELDAFYATYGDGQGDDGNAANGPTNANGDVGDNDIIGAGAPLTDHILGRIDNGATAFVEGDFELADRPATMVNLGTWYRTETGRTKGQLDTWDVTADDFDRKPLTYFVESGDFDASYPTDAGAYTAATGSCPAGDLNWFPAQYATCDELATDGEAGPGYVSGQVRLFPAAPNPTRGAVTMAYELATAGPVEMTIVNLLGQTVATVVPSQTMPAGPHAARWDGELAAGLYIVRLQTEGATVTRRMTVVR